jgi:transient receptor potential cation channel subfamily C
LKIPACTDDAEDMLPHKEMGQLSFEEKKFLLAVERGDVATVRRYDYKIYFIVTYTTLKAV